MGFSHGVSCPFSLVTSSSSASSAAPALSSKSGLAQPLAQPLRNLTPCPRPRLAAEAICHVPARHGAQGSCRAGFEEPRRDEAQPSVAGGHQSAGRHQHRYARHRLSHGAQDIVAATLALLPWLYPSHGALNPLQIQVGQSKASHGKLEAFMPSFSPLVVL